MWVSPLVVASLTFGLTSSFHCAVMCGPLTSALLVARPLPLLSYVAARTLSYGLVGALAGSAGHLFVRALPLYLAPGLALLGALIIGSQALGVSFPGERPTWAQRLSRRALGSPFAFTPVARGATLGGLTALLPCGLLASVYALAISTGSALAGATTAACFALASTLGLIGLPRLLGLFPAQGSGARLGSFVQRGALFVAAGVLMFRAFSQACGTDCH